MQATQIPSSHAHLQRSVTPEVFWMVDLQLRYKYFVGEALERLGARQNQPVGGSLYDTYEREHPVIIFHKEAFKGRFGIRYSTDWAGFIFQCRLCPVPGPSGIEHVVGYGVIINDLTGLVVPDGDEVLRVPEIAAMLSISEEAVRKRFQRGLLRGRKEAGKWITTRYELDHFRR